MISPIDPGPITYCEKCEVNFCLFPFHLRLFHDGKKENKCAFCGSLFLNLDDLLVHIELHNDRGDLFCCRCLRRFDTDEELVNHLETHRELHVFYCFKCRKTFASKAGLTSHDCQDIVDISVSIKEESENTSDNPCSMTLRRGPIVKMRKRKVQMSSSTFSESSAPRQSLTSSEDDSLINEVPSKIAKKESQHTDIVLSTNPTSALENDKNPSGYPSVDTVNTRSKSDPNNSRSGALENSNALKDSTKSDVRSPKKRSTEVVSLDCPSRRISPRKASGVWVDTSPAKSNNAWPTLLSIKMEDEDEISLDQVSVPVITVVEEGLNLTDAQMDVSNEAHILNMMKTEANGDLNHNASLTSLDASETMNKKTRKMITFNEKVECWNPVSKERIWLAITEETEETREVPLLVIPPVKKKKKVRKNKNDKGNQKKKKTKNDKKTPKKPPSKVTPPTSKLQLEAFAEKMLKRGKEASDKKQRKKMVLTKSRLMNDKSLLAKYGGDFHYDQCIKEDGRYHCPEDDCSNCRGFADVRGLRNHIRVHHIKSTRFICWQCGKTFAISCKLKAHMITHTVTKGYVCDICGKLFKTMSTYTNHKGIHTMPWQCHHCDRRFSVKYSLKIHLRVSHCSCCDVTLRCAELFKRHEEEVNHVYSCVLCTYETSWRNRFSWHIGTAHYSETTQIDGSYKCEICDRKFATRTNAVRHVRKQHSELKSTKKS